MKRGKETENLLAKSYKKVFLKERKKEDKTLLEFPKSLSNVLQLQTKDVSLRYTRMHVISKSTFYLIFPFCNTILDYTYS